MFLISHRGNTNGKTISLENKPQQILQTMQLGYHVEIDVWYDGWTLYLGHNEPQYQTDLFFLQNEKLWCHAKNLQALQYMLENNIQCFWHQEDNYTLTNSGYIWTYPQKPVCEKTIIVCDTLEDTIKYSKMNIAGICSDYIGEIK